MLINRHILFCCLWLSCPTYMLALQVVEITPLSQSLTSSRNTAVTILFDQELNPSTINASSISVFGHWSGVAIGTFDLVEGNKRVRFTPATLFNAGEWVCVNISKFVQALSGDKLAHGYAWHFWIKPSAGSIELEEIERISVREFGEGHIQTYGAHGGDLNHDGFSDFFVPNEISNDCRVFINDGAGYYSDFDIYPIPNGSRPSTNESADFNRDGHLDLAVGNSTGDSITVFLGDGEGGFFSVRNYQAAPGIRGLAVADLNGDGAMDIVTANRAADNLSILHNLGDGTFAPRIIIDANSTGETACATADANGDGILDLFVGAHTSAEISLLLGNGFGGFTFSDKVEAGGNGPWMIAVGDINKDGNVDVASVNAQSSNVAVIFGDGSGGLSPVQNYATGSFPIAIDLGDIDADEDLELMTSSFNSGTWTYWENDGTGLFINQRTLDAQLAASCATFHDRDNDGDLDMTGIDELEDLIFLFRNNGTTSTKGSINQDHNIIKIYPNPSESGWYVEVPDLKCYQMRILDLSGKFVLNILCSEQITNFIPADEMEDGTYMVQIFDFENKLIGVQKVVFTQKE